MTLATRVPILDTDTERVKAIKAGLNAYFAAVSVPLSDAVSKQEKLERIAAVFAANAELVTPSGLVLQGNQQVTTFYASDESPVMKDANFCPQVHLETLSISANCNTIACEIVLTPHITVGDFFTFDAAAKICRMKIYQSK